MASLNRSRRRKYLLAMYILLSSEEAPQAPQSRRRVWVREWIQRRPLQGIYGNLLEELRLGDEASYSNYLRLDYGTFTVLLDRVRHHIEKQNTNYRPSISAGERLAITLRFLATGESYRSLQYQFRVGERTIGSIIPETCMAIYDALRNDFLKAPESEQEWMKIADGFKSRWNLPHCVGALDGKHVVMKAPMNSGSTYYNYKNCFSIVLLALVDHDYNFVFVDAGSNGRVADGGVFAQSTIHEKLENNTMGIPEPQNLPNTTTKMPFFIVADDAFPLRSYLLKPYPDRDLTRDQRIYNYRISRARRIVENAFGILSNRFRIFLTNIALEPEIVEVISIAACALHNFIRKSTTANADTTLVADGVEVQPVEDTATAGQMIPLEPRRRPGRPTERAKAGRATMVAYFSSNAGAVAWQDAMV